MNLKSSLFNVAPMMKVTDRHFRAFIRLILGDKAMLFTEMITTQALAFNLNAHRLLAHNSVAESPLSLQIGGSSVSEVEKAMHVAVSSGLSHVNLNCGCPSKKVACGCFGAILMKSPALVGEICKIMKRLSDKESIISVKCRIGLEDEDSVDLIQFVTIVHEMSGVKDFHIHARKAILNRDLSPRSNLTIPPLEYDVVYELIRATRHLGLNIYLNGGIKSYEDIDSHLRHDVSGVMIGRSIQDDPYYWSLVNCKVFKDMNHVPRNRRDILLDYGQYVDMNGQESNLTSIWRPLDNLFHMCPGNRKFRQWVALSISQKQNPTSTLLKQAVDMFEPVLPLSEIASDYISRRL